MERGWKPNIELSPACPRCGSSNTKFCYYNNYSLTQPRYFCKGCRRYWTKGGSLRNVPIGGGCRKARRGKSARAAADAARSLPHANRIETSCSASAGAPTGIDLAAVYANFLNQSPRPPPENCVTSAIAIPPIEFSSFHMNMNQLSSQLPQENGFFECGSFPIRFSETQLFGNSAYLGGLEAAFQKQQFTAAAAVGNIGFADVSDVLPPLPGEEAAAVVSGGIIWPSSSSNLIIENQMLPSETQQNPEVLSPFSGLNLEAIFRS